MKRLSEYISEKLIINKDSKFVSLNDYFYDEFKEYLDEWPDWLAVLNSEVIPLAMDETWKTHIMKFFKADKSVFVHYVSDNRHTSAKEKRMYEKMIEFLRKNSEEVTYKNSQSNKTYEYLIYLLKTDKLRIGIWGNNFVANDKGGTIAIQKI